MDKVLRMKNLFIINIDISMMRMGVNDLVDELKK